MLANKWGVLNSTIPIQDKPDQVDLVVQNTEIAETLNNKHNEEDLLLESAMREEASQQAAEANMSYGETVMEARKTVVNEPNPPLRVDEPVPEKALKDYVPERYHEYLDVFMEKEAIPLPPHRPWDHVITLTPDVPPSISCRVYPLSRGEEEFQAKYIQEQEDAGLI